MIKIVVDQFDIQLIIDKSSQLLEIMQIYSAFSNFTIIYC